MNFQHILDFKVRKKLILQDWGKNDNPTIKTLLKIAKALNVKIEDLL